MPARFDGYFDGLSGEQLLRVPRGISGRSCGGRPSEGASVFYIETPAIQNCEREQLHSLAALFSKPSALFIR